MASSDLIDTTPRKRLSPTQKIGLYKAQKGICPLCQGAMERTEKLIDEHLTPLALGGSNDLSNRAVVHALCAYLKTYGSEGDRAAIDKAKRVERKSFGFTKEAPPIRGRALPAGKPKRRASTPLEKAMPPRRSLFADAR